MSNLCVVCLIVSFFTVSHATDVSREYTVEPEFENKKTSNELVGQYEARSLSECAAMCQVDCALFGYNHELKNCRIHRKIFTSGMSDETGWRYFFPEYCKDLCENGNNKSGVYGIYPYGTKSIRVKVYCDMETMDGGWTVIQKRVNGSLSFLRSWKDYKNGFGSPEEDVWIGNDVIHQLTKGKNSNLYVSITVQKNKELYELYNRFSVSNETEKYKLFLAGPAWGTLGDGMLNTGLSVADLSGMYFTTQDRDNDRHGGNCADDYKGAWWFNACHYANLNGQWYPAHWFWPWHPRVDDGSSVGGTKMMIKRQ